ncbi:hypothetical protein [Mycobacterium sp. IDR2000157661]|uniref:hypothetical protein n=1 Tax=Mycobacterium sp. IDR2000157661 TaxID=2867005 RepID=UPI001EEACD24|nr:hypothetical protein [Mycobacterium sp. IDR2000157661]ULE31482.1 hypothetical protein K3G64_14735 [Mycobacterium sp. IDR2000157661]
MSGEVRKPEGIGWNAASVELPPVPTVPAGPDSMSSTIAAVLPTLAAQLTANVATLSAKETTFSGKVGAAQAAYQNSDDAGSQSVGQVVGMLGQLGQQAGQMGQSARAPMQALSGQTGMFGSLMQQAVQGQQGREDADARQPLQRADDQAVPGAGPGHGDSRAAPLTPPTQQHYDDDVARNL